MSDTIPATQQTRWSLEADMDTEQSVIILKGDSKAEVLSKLGTPRRTRPVNANPKAVVLRYVRTVAGPLRYRQARTKTGTMTIRDNVRYSDSIDVYLENDLVVAVEIDRNSEVPFGQQYDPLK